MNSLNSQTLSVQIYNSTKSTILTSDATIADTFITRLIGLLNRKSLKEGEGLIIPGCNNIHTFFMRFALDVIFLKTQMGTDKITDERRLSEASVVKTVSCLKPFRLSCCPDADSVLELPSGTIAKTKTQAGDCIEFGSSGVWEFRS